MDREKVINQLDADIRRADRTGEMLVYVGLRTAREALSLLKEQEAVVHCKDCRNACACDNGMAVCTHVDSNGSDTHSENWFCGDGKRRET